MKKHKGTPEKPVNEKEFRQRLINMARRFNCEGDVRQIFEKYDRLLKNCTNEEERKHIAVTGIAELHNFFYCKGALVVNGEIVLPAQEEIELNSGLRVIKLD